MTIFSPHAYSMCMVGLCREGHIQYMYGWVMHGVDSRNCFNAYELNFTKGASSRAKGGERACNTYRWHSAESY